MRKNILISTTRQWNPGDEFIMMGALCILKNLYGDILNPIIYNRNPDIRVGCMWRSSSHGYKKTYKWDKKYWKGKSIISEIFRIGQYDNSWKDDMNISNIDFALFAGSPEWYGKRLKTMYKVIERGNIPSLFLGLGAGDSVDFSKANSIVDRTLSKAIFIATRDRQTEQLLKIYNAKYLPCPALFSAPFNKLVKKVNRIALIYATNETLKGNNVSKEMHDYIIYLYKKLGEKFDVSLVCHYIDEIDRAKEEFPHYDIYYSYDAKDYINIYNNFDLGIGGRVHGIGMCASLGITGIMIKHDSRSSTTDGFLAHSIKIGTTIEEVQDLIYNISNNVKDYSQKLIDHKEITMNQYIDILQDRLMRVVN